MENVVIPIDQAKAWKYATLWNVLFTIGATFLFGTTGAAFGLGIGGLAFGISATYYGKIKYALVVSTVLSLLVIVLMDRLNLSMFNPVLFFWPR